MFKYGGRESREPVIYALIINNDRDSAYAVPTTKNYAPELPALGVIAGVSPTVVQWKGLVLGEPPC